MSSHVTGAFHGAYNLGAWGVGQVTSRATNGAYAVQAAYLSVISAALAVVNAAGDLATWGRESDFRWSATTSADSLNFEFTTIYVSLLKTLNPNARILELCEEDTKTEDGTEKHPLAEGRLPISKTACKLRPLAIMQQDTMDYLNRPDDKGGNWVNRHVTARLAAPVMAVAMIVAAVFATLCAALIAVLSIITLGSIRGLNSTAYHHLITPGFILNQLHQGLLGIVRPDLV